MISKRILVSALLVGLLPSLAACGSDSTKPSNAVNPWQNKTYLLNIPESHWNKPNHDVAKDIGGFVPSFLLSFQKATSSEAEVLLGTSDANGVQDHCSPTTLIHSTSPNPLTIGPIDAPVRIIDTTHDKAVTITGYDLTISNLMPKSDPASETGVFSATVDARELYSLFYLISDPTPEKVCADLSQVKAECIPCPRDQESFCVTLGAVSLSAVPLDNGTVDEVTATGVPASCEQQGDGGA